MSEPQAPAHLEERILLLAPTRRDATAAVAVFGTVGIALVICEDVAAVCEEFKRGAAVAIVPDEAILNDPHRRLSRCLEEQPPWSDFPLIVLSPPNRTPAAVRELEAVGHMTLVRRPIEIRSLASSIRAALRDRRRQYARREDLAERERQAEALRRNDRQKDEFLAMLAHELRNPLAAISNAIEVAQRSPGDEPQQHWAKQVIEGQVRNFTRLIDDLLDVSRITRGRIDLRKQVVDVRPIIERAVAAATRLVQQRRHVLNVEFAHGAAAVEVDPTRLEQVVVNLLNNAAKYSEDEGRIMLATGIADGALTITVRDTGIGIPTEQLLRIFDLFTQGDRSIARSEGGLGIGLTLVKKLVELHGGTVSAWSEGPGRGSEFVLRLPVAGPTPAPARPTTHTGRTSGASGVQVLVVDDNADTVAGMARLLALSGHAVRTASDGPTALVEARASRPDVVLLDIGLPGMDGYQVATELRQDPAFRATRLIALSGYGQEQDRARSRAAGFDHHLVKPVIVDDLLTLLGNGGG